MTKDEWLALGELRNTVEQAVAEIARLRAEIKALSKPSMIGCEVPEIVRSGPNYTPLGKLVESYSAGQIPPEVCGSHPKDSA